MSSSPDLNPILDDLAAGRIDAAEASRRIEAARAAVPAEPAEPHESESWRAYAREETRPHETPAPAEPTRAPAAGAQPTASAADVSDEPPAPKPAGAKGRGAERVSIRSVGRRVRVIGDPSVASVAVTGPHVLRRSGGVLEVASEGQATPLEGFSLLKLPRSLDDLKNLGLGTELVIQVNPRLTVDAEVTGSGLAIEGVPTLGRIRVTAGGASLRGVRQASDVLVQMGSALVEGPFAEGRSRVKCESGALTVSLTEGANVTVRGQANMGRLNWPGEGLGVVDEWIVGNGSRRLDVEIVMGMATIKDTTATGAGGAGSESSAKDGDPTCPSCGGAVGGGRFCPHCGTPLAHACSGCGKTLPSGAKFCPECGVAA